VRGELGDLPIDPRDLYTDRPVDLTKAEEPKPFFPKLSEKGKARLIKIFQRKRFMMQ